MERSLDMETLNRLTEFNYATDEELAEAVRMGAGQMPKHALSPADLELREHLLFTVRALLCRGLR